MVGTYKAQCGKGFLWVSWRGKCLRKSWTGGRSFRRISSRHTKLINWDGFLFLYLYQAKAESREKLSSSAPHATVSMGNPNEASGTLFPGGKRHFTTLCVEGSYLYVLWKESLFVELYDLLALLSWIILDSLVRHNHHSCAFHCHCLVMYVWSFTHLPAWSRSWRGR